MIARLNSFSWPLISWRSSGIDVNPSSANMTTPIGSMKYVVLNVVRFEVWIDGMNLMKMPNTIAMIAKTPHVSIFFNPFSPSLRSNVMTSQNMIPNTIGWISPGINFERDSPSPTK